MSANVMPLIHYEVMAGGKFHEFIAHPDDFHKGRKSPSYIDYKIKNRSGKTRSVYCIVKRISDADYVGLKQGIHHHEHIVARLRDVHGVDLLKLPNHDDSTHPEVYTRAEIILKRTRENAYFLYPFAVGNEAVRLFKDNLHGAVKDRDYCIHLHKRQFAFIAPNVSLTVQAKLLVPAP
ncbi:MAG TPA: hypothetical protein VHL98_22060 [Microvirga sp.]|nr:hypothetical protein [Microvirga sp.]